MGKGERSTHTNAPFTKASQLEGKSFRQKIAWWAAGLLFAILWASASSATKIGLATAQPLVIANVRFAVAALILLFLGHVVLKHRFPQGKQWRQLLVYGLLNITIYLGLYVIAMQSVTAGIGALAIASNPVFIGFLSVFFLKKRLTPSIILAIFICVLGVLCAAWPLLGTAAVSAGGLALLMTGMLSYSVAALYFSAKDWEGLPLVVINGWQTLFGGVLLLPVTLLFYKHTANHFTATFWLASTWLAVPVSIVAVQLWLWLLQRNAVSAGLWLFLCPLFGFVFAAWLLKDPISIYTVIGMLLVVGGLLLSRAQGSE